MTEMSFALLLVVIPHLIVVCSIPLAANPLNFLEIAARARENRPAATYSEQDFRVPEYVRIAEGARRPNVVVQVPSGVPEYVKIADSLRRKDESAAHTKATPSYQKPNDGNRFTWKAQETTRTEVKEAEKDGGNTFIEMSEPDLNFPQIPDASYERLDEGSEDDSDEERIYFEDTDGDNFRMRRTPSYVARNPVRSRRIRKGKRRVFGGGETFLLGRSTSDPMKYKRDKRHRIRPSKRVERGSRKRKAK